MRRAHRVFRSPRASAQVQVPCDVAAQRTPLRSLHVATASQSSDIGGRAASIPHKLLATFAAEAVRDSPADTLVDAQGRLHVVDPHHHLLDPVHYPDLYRTLSKVHAVRSHLADDYLRDMRHAATTTTAGQAEAQKAAAMVGSQNIQEVRVLSSVHVEVLPDNNIEELCFVLRERENYADGSLAAGLVASFDPSCASGDAIQQLDRIMTTVSRARGLRGVRWITNYAGALAAGETPIVSRATWPNVKMDYTTSDQFNRGLYILADRGLSFDLQSNPSHLKRWAGILREIPSLDVILDHMGHPRQVIQDDGSLDEAQISEWREGLQELAKLPNVSVKLSMMAYCAPNWWRDGQECKRKALQSLVYEVIDLFGPERCMFASNWPVDGEDGAKPLDLYGAYYDWSQARYGTEGSLHLFQRTARRVYKL